jgi:hypothetical protein
MAVIIKAQLVSKDNFIHNYPIFIR